MAIFPALQKLTHMYLGSAAAGSLELQGEGICFLKVPNCLLT